MDLHHCRPELLPNTMLAIMLTPVKEGVVSCAIALASFFIIVDFPERGTSLTCCASSTS